MEVKNPQVRLDIEAILEETKKFLESGRYIGHYVPRLEHVLGKRFGLPVACCASGTMAIYLALLSANIKPGDEVITVANAGYPTPSAIAMTGATIVFADVDENGLMDPSSLCGAISNKTRAIIPVHLYGNPCRCPNRYNTNNLAIIEDACQAFGTQHIHTGHLACYSFYPTKNLGTTGEGGAIVVLERPDLIDWIRSLRTYGEPSDSPICGTNGRMNEFSALCLLEAEKVFDVQQARRLHILDLYRSRLPILYQEGGSGHQIVVRLHNRDRVRQWLAEEGITTQIHYPVPMTKTVKFSQCRRSSYWPGNTERQALEVLSLPSEIDLEDDDIERICDILLEIGWFAI